MASVTVVVPTYEREDLIVGALESALTQTYDDLIVSVGDNSTSDRTEKAIAAIGDPRIRYHRHCPGIGPQRNWIDLIERADTPLVATLHDDDLWHPEFLESVVPPMLQDPSVAMTFTDFWCIDDDGDRMVEYTELESARTHRSTLPAGCVDYDRDDGLRLVAVWNAPQPAYAAVLRRDDVLACEFPEEISPLYDIWLTYQLVQRKAVLRYEPRRLTNYRVHAGSTTTKGFSVPEDEVFRRILADNADAGEIVDEVKEYWSTLRWARGTRLMAADGSVRADSQTELGAAAEGLHGPKRFAAQAAAKSSLVWHAMRACRRTRHRYFNGEPTDEKDSLRP